MLKLIMEKFNHRISLVLISSLLLLTLSSCGKSGNDLTAYNAKKEDFNYLINSKRMPAKPDLANHKTILNRDYPIEIALFADGKFYYDLPNLGDGNGTWKYTKGHIELNAKRSLFDMKILVHALEENAADIGIEFYDRFGRNFIQVEKINTTK